MVSEYWLVRWTDRSGKLYYLTAVGDWSDRNSAHRFSNKKQARLKVKIAEKWGLRPRAKVIHVTVHRFGYCAKELRLLKLALTPNDSAPVSFVTLNRLVRLPEFVISALKIPNGGGVVFNICPDGRVQILSNDDAAMQMGWK